MNILMMTLMYPQDQMAEVTANAKDKLQNQINNYQHAFVKGIRANQTKVEQLDILNCLPVGIFPLQYRQLFLKAGKHDGGVIEQIGCINLPFFKQRGRRFSAYRAAKKWVKKNPNNRTILVYTQYLPYMQALVKLKKRFRDVRVAVIVTDLPNEMGLETGRKGLLKSLETKMGRESIRCLRQMDGFIFLTEPMADALQLAHKPYEVIEGLILQNTKDTPQTGVSTQRPAFLYTGTLESSLGIGEMLEAFSAMPEYDLWICGHGGMKEAVEESAKNHPNIHFLGFVAQEEALAMQASATALLNPRQPTGLFTKYSFPSKTLEYMRSGKPVLCCRLEGIPADYDDYLSYMDEGAEGMCRAVRGLMERSDEERKQMGQKARDYVHQSKNPEVQCQKLVELLRRL